MSFATILCLIPENVYERSKNNRKRTGRWFFSYFTVKSTDVFLQCMVFVIVTKKNNFCDLLSAFLDENKCFNKGTYSSSKEFVLRGTNSFLLELIPIERRR